MVREIPFHAQPGRERIGDGNFFQIITRILNRHAHMAGLTAQERSGLEAAYDDELRLLRRAPERNERKEKIRQCQRDQASVFKE